MTSFAIALYGQCCSDHIVGQRVVSDISEVCSSGSICSLCSETNNTSLLLRLLIAVFGTSALRHILVTRSLPYNIQSQQIDCQKQITGKLYTSAKTYFSVQHLISIRNCTKAPDVTTSCLVIIDREFSHVIALYL